MAEPRRRARTPPGAVTAGRLWGGRFSAGPAAQVAEYTDSLAIDRRLYREDIAGSTAHARMLAAAGIISAADGRAIEQGLRRVLKEMDGGSFEFQPGDEDIHTAVERRLGEVAGVAVGGKLHTGRSRNDQVALDTRLFARARILELGLEVCELQDALLGRARQHRDDLLPAYTHLQRAQPTTIGHHLSAYIEMFQRDFDRLRDAYARADVLPLGSAAATGSGLPLKREMVARELRFARLSENSLDAVSDRDFVVELEAVCALLMVHLSRLGEEWVLWSSQEFGFVELPDDYSTGSSLMPQKKNPDIAELMRGRAGRVIGDLVGILATLKGLPLAYNRDLQEDKAGLFDATDTALASLSMATALVARSSFNLEHAAAAASDPAMLATEVADHLVRQGMPFRQAHEVVGRAVRLAAGSGTSLAGLGLEGWQQVEPSFGAGVLAALDPRRALRSRTMVGSPGPRPLQRSLTRAAGRLRKNRSWLAAQGGPGGA